MEDEIVKIHKKRGCNIFLWKNHYTQYHLQNGLSTKTRDRERDVASELGMRKG